MFWDFKAGKDYFQWDKEKEVVFEEGPKEGN